MPGRIPEFDTGYHIKFYSVPEQTEYDIWVHLESRDVHIQMPARLRNTIKVRGENFRREFLFKVGKVSFSLKPEVRKRRTLVQPRMWEIDDQLFTAPDP